MMRQFVFLWFFVLTFISLGCDKEAAFLVPVVNVTPPPASGELAGLNKSHQIKAFSMDGDYVEMTYDARGRITSRSTNGALTESYSYSEEIMNVTQVGQVAQTVHLNSMGYADSYMGSSYSYFTSGKRKGYISSVSKQSSVNGFILPVVTQFSVDSTGNYTAFTVYNGGDIKSYTISYGTTPNYSDSFNPLLTEYGLAFLGRASLRLPIRIDCSDNTFRVFEYSFYPSGHVKTMEDRYFKSGWTLYASRSFGADWMVNGMVYTGGALKRRAVLGRVASVVVDGASILLSYNTQGKLSHVIQKQDGVEEHLQIAYPFPDSVQINEQMVALNDSGCILSYAGNVYQYNEAGYLVRKTELTGDVVNEELYSYNAAKCVSDVVKRWKFTGDAEWKGSDAVSYVYEDVLGRTIRNMTTCIDVARENYWNPLLGKVSPFFPVREVNDDYSIDIIYEFNPDSLPTKITYIGSSGLGQSDEVLLRWPSDGAGFP